MCLSLRAASVRTTFSKVHNNFMKYVQTDSFPIYLAQTIKIFNVLNLQLFLYSSGGPLPEELLPQIRCPVRILWGEIDPWEPIDMGRDYAKFAVVDEFVTLPRAGHCPMDQVPDKVNYELLRFLQKYG